jgi:hypothetical protein
MGNGKWEMGERENADCPVGFAIHDFPFPIPGF